NLSEADVIKASDRYRQMSRFLPGFSEKFHAVIRKGGTLDEAKEITNEAAIDLTKHVASLMNDPAKLKAEHSDLVEKIIEKLERKRPEYLKITKRQWITDEGRRK